MVGSTGSAVGSPGLAVGGTDVGAAVESGTTSSGQQLVRTTPAALIVANWINSRLVIFLFSDIGILLISKLDYFRLNG
jgi:hypothetical protein